MKKKSASESQECQSVKNKPRFFNSPGEESNYNVYTYASLGIHSYNTQM